MNDSTKDSLIQGVALTHLRFVQEEIAATTNTDAVNKRVRLHYVRLARDSGVTHKAIGDALCVTEGAVRAILKGTT